MARMDRSSKECSECVMGNPDTRTRERVKLGPQLRIAVSRKPNPGIPILLFELVLLGRKRHGSSKHRVIG